jgi:hypothetical protein
MSVPSFADRALMALALLSVPFVALAAQDDPAGDIPEKFVKPEGQNDYVKRRRRFRCVAHLARARSALRGWAPGCAEL